MPRLYLAFWREATGETGTPVLRWYMQDAGLDEANRQRAFSDALQQTSQGINHHGACYASNSSLRRVPEVSDSISGCVQPVP